MAGSYKKYRILAYLFGEDGKDAKKCVCICAYCLFSVLSCSGINLWRYDGSDEIL